MLPKAPAFQLPITERKRAEKSLVNCRKSCLRFVWQHLTAYSPHAAGQRPVRLAAVPSRRLAQGDTIEGKPFFNNQIARAKITLFASAPSSSLSAALSHCPIRAMLACALRSFSSQKSHFVAIFGNPVAETFRPLGKGVNACDFYYLSRKENHTFPQRNSIWQNFACCRKGECAALL